MQKSTHSRIKQQIEHVIAWILYTTSVVSCNAEAPGAAATASSQFTKALPTAVVRTNGTGASLAGLQAVVNSPLYIQGVVRDQARTSLIVVDKERATTLQGWDISEIALASDFQLTQVTTRQSHEFFVAGVTDGGRDVIERWTIQPAQGAHFFSREQSSAAPGTEVDGASAVTLGIIGGVYIPSSQRNHLVPQSRQSIYRGTTFGGIATLKVDPDGRCLFVVGKSPPALYRLPNHGSALPTVVLTEHQVPELAAARGSFVGQHATDGRIYTISTSLANQHKKLVLFDANNDLIFEEHLVMTTSDYDTAFVGPVWVTDFRNFFE